MKSRVFLVAMMTAVLVMPATTALAADQDVDVQVYPLNSIAIEVQELLMFVMVPGQTKANDFWMQVTNTTSGAWQVTVEGNDLESYQCEGMNCATRVPTDPPYMIAKANLVVTGGDLCWTGEGCDPATDGLVTAYSEALSDSGPVLIMEGAADAWGSFAFGQSGYQPTVQLTIPAEAATSQYSTTLIYTISAP